MANPLVELISISQQTENLLETRFGAQGRGLREKLDSVADQIPETIRQKIRFIATTRNLAAHGELDNAQKKLREVRQAFAVVRPALASPPSKRSRRRAKKVRQNRPTLFSALAQFFARFSFASAPGASFVRLDAIVKKTERLLTRNYKASGRGLHDKLSSVEHKLSEATQRKIRFIATIRNKAAHEDVRVADENIEAVEEAFADILPALDRRAPLRKFAFWAGASLFVALAAFVAYRVFL